MEREDYEGGRVRSIVGWVIFALAFILCLLSIERLLVFLSTYSVA